MIEDPPRLVPTVRTKVFVLDGFPAPTSSAQGRMRSDEMPFKWHRPWNWTRFLSFLFQGRFPTRVGLEPAAPERVEKLENGARMTPPYSTATPASRPYHRPSRKNRSDLVATTRANPGKP